MIDYARILLLAAMIAWPAALTAGADQNNGQSGPPPGYALVWSDEFDLPGLPDPEKWGYDTERNAEGWWNGEAQYYAADRLENARIENGVLIIEAHREQLDPAEYPDWGGQDYTSARLVTAGLAEWRYGFIEVRAKLPCGRGSWPAIWTLGAEPHDNWPIDGEIDILEHVGYDPDWIHASVNTAAYNHSRRTGHTVRKYLSDPCEAFHNYQLTWTETEIRIGIDGRNYFHFANDGLGDQETWPFYRPQYLLLNIAVGGAWGGNHGIDDTIFPIKMEVDYVRVYQHQSED